MSGSANGERKLVCVNSVHIAQRRDELRRTITTAFARSEATRQDKIQADIEFGGHWAEFKLELKKTGMTIKEFLEVNRGPCSHQHGNGCERAWRLRDELPMAHDWYEQSADALNLPMIKRSGWEYVVAVVPMYRARESGTTRPAVKERQRPKRPDLETLKRDLNKQKSKTSNLQVHLLQAYLPEYQSADVAITPADKTRARRVRDLAISITFPEERDTAFEQLCKMATKRKVKLAKLLYAIQ